jgi:hypothetical protein
MAKILIVHGIANQYVGEMELLAAWYPALCDGLLRAEHRELPSLEECLCPFYGDLFRSDSHMSGDREPDLEDLEQASEDEVRLLEAIWKSAAQMDPEVPSPEEYAETMVWMPRIAERALNSLARSKYLADYTPLQLFGDLEQVTLYLNDAAIHEKALGRVTAHIGPETRVVIGHSLGSVIAYEAVCARPQQVAALITVGSPLGIRNVVFDKLTPRPRAIGIGDWPGAVKQWTNIAADGDIVAAQKELAPLFGNDVHDVRIDSGWDAHSSTRYLNTAQAGEALFRGLAG